MLYDINIWINHLLIHCCRLRICFWQRRLLFWLHTVFLHKFINLVTDANFDPPLNLWKLVYTESIFIAFLVIFARKLHQRIKQHSLRSEKYYFLHITSPDATRFELTIAEGFINGWTKRLTLQILFTVSINKIYGGVSSGKNKVRNVLTF